MRKAKIGTWEVDWRDQEDIAEMEESTLKPAPGVGDHAVVMGEKYIVVDYVKQGAVTVLKKIQNKVKTCVFMF